MASYRRVDQVIVPSDIPAATGRVNAIALISIRVAESIILYE
jgi:hypothetical protein